MSIRRERIVMKRALALFFALTLVLAGCTPQSTTVSDETLQTATPDSSDNSVSDSKTAVVTNMPSIEESFTERDLAGTYEENDATKIVFGDTIEVDGAGAKTSGKVCMITAEGTYIISGESDDARIEVKAGDKAKVQLVLRGVNLMNQTGSVVYIESAKKVFITLAEGTENKLSDAGVFSSATNEDAVIFSKADLTLNGKGSLSVAASYAHGIISKDDLIITGGTYEVASTKTAFGGKDCIRIADGNFTVNAGTDAFKSKNSDDEAKGNVYIYGGTYKVHAEGDAFSASAALYSCSGTFDITTSTGSESAEHKGGFDFDKGGFGRKDGYDNTSSDGESAKGFKAKSELVISGGTYVLDTLDDALHTNGAAKITGGTFSLSAGDDAIHADTELEVAGGNIDVITCYEGFEAVNITIDAGSISITASDDGINANGEERQAEGTLTINEGYLNLTAGGDGLDSNGYIYVNGGTVMVSGPENNGNGALDYGAKGVVTGGVLVICGSSGMAQNFGSESTQCTVLCNMNSIAANTRISCVDAKGNIVVSFVPVHTYSSVLFSAPDMAVGETYTIMTGGECDADENGFACSGTLTGGANLGDITLTKTASTFGSGKGRQ